MDACIYIYIDWRGRASRLQRAFTLSWALNRLCNHGPHGKPTWKVGPTAWNKNGQMQWPIQPIVGPTVNHPFPQANPPPSLGPTPFSERCQLYNHKWALLLLYPLIIITQFLLTLIFQVVQYTLFIYLGIPSFRDFLSVTD